MEVALELFAEQGYTRTSISAIASQACISKGLLYNYFESKEDLLKQIMDEGLQEMLTFFDPNHDGVLTRDEFIYFIREVFQLIDRKRTFYKLYFSVVMQPRVMTLIEETVMDILEPLMTMLAAYYHQKGSKSPQAEAIMVGALLDGIGFNFVVNPEAFPLDEVLELIIEKFV